MPWKEQLFVLSLVIKLDSVVDPLLWRSYASKGNVLIRAQEDKFRRILEKYQKKVYERPSWFSSENSVFDNLWHF